LTKAFKKELIAYVKQGGSLLIIGYETAKLFKKELGLKTSAKKQVQTGIWLETDGWLGGVKTDVFEVQRVAGQVFSRYYTRDDKRAERGIAASVRKLGKGQIAGAYFNIGEAYWKRRNHVMRDWLGSLVGQLFRAPLVEVKGSHWVDVTVNRLADGRLAINLVNTSGPHGDEDVYVFDEIASLGPLTVSVRLKKRPAKVTWEPEHRKLNFTYERGKLVVELPRLAIHEIIVIE